MVVLLQVKDLIQIIAMFKTEKFMCTFLSCTKYLFEGHKVSCTKTTLCSFEIERLFSRYTIWFMIFEKSITRCIFLHRGARMHQKSQRSKQNFQLFQPLNYLRLDDLVIFTNMYTYILTKGRNFKILLKEFNLFTKKMLNMELNMILIVALMELAYYLRYS